MEGDQEDIGGNIKHFTNMRIEERSLEEQAEELKKIPGNVKGEVFNTFIPYIRKKEGEEGLRKVMERLRELGCEFDDKEINSFQMYPNYLGALFIVIPHEIFDWTEDDVFEMGYEAPRRSFIIKMLLKYLVSVEKLFQEASTYWEKHFDFGSLEAAELNQEEGYMIVRIHGYHFHPLVCTFHAGYFKGVVGFCVKEKELSVEETKCNHRGDDYHEFIIRWN